MKVPFFKETVELRPSLGAILNNLRLDRLVAVSEPHFSHMSSGKTGSFSLVLLNEGTKTTPRECPSTDGRCSSHLENTHTT